MPVLAPVTIATLLASIVIVIPLGSAYYKRAYARTDAILGGRTTNADPNLAVFQLRYNAALRGEQRTKALNA